MNIPNKNLDSLWNEFRQANVNVKNTIFYIYEKIAFYSAGIISLSITFLGYFLFNDS